MDTETYICWRCRRSSPLWDGGAAASCRLDRRGAMTMVDLCEECHEVMTRVLGDLRHRQRQDEKKRPPQPVTLEEFVGDDDLDLVLHAPRPQPPQEHDRSLHGWFLRYFRKTHDEC